MRSHGPQWQTKVQKIIQTCQDELKKTTEIGKKMLNASKTNSCLHESYEKLGMLVEKELENNNLQWDNPQVKELLDQIGTCKNDLEDIEIEVNKIKFSKSDLNQKDSDSHNHKESKE